MGVTILETRQDHAGADAQSEQVRRIIFDFDEIHTCVMCRLPVHPQATMPEKAEEVNLSDLSDLSDVSDDVLEDKP